MSKPEKPKFNDFRDGGYIPLQWDLLRSKKLNLPQKLVIAYLLKKVNPESGFAWPSQSLIARALGVDVRTVKRTLKSLCYRPGENRENKRKVIEVHKHYCGRASGYRLDLAAITALCPAKIGKKPATVATSETQTQPAPILAPSAPPPAPDALQHILTQIRNFKSAYPQAFPNCVTAFRRKLERELQWMPVYIDIAEISRLYGIHGDQLEGLVMSTFKE